MYLGAVCTATLCSFLLQIDRDLAAEMRRGSCRWCGAPLHSACYLRQPKGLPAGVDPGPEFALCFSFCCSREGCRRRHRAPSVRFLDRKVYLSVMVLLVSAMRQGPTPRTARELKRLFGVDRRTLVRWRTWWQTLVPRTRFWQRHRAQFAEPVAEGELPQSLIDRFAAGDLQERIVDVLRFLSGLFGAASAS